MMRFIQFKRKMYSRVSMRSLDLQYSTGVASPI